MTSHQSEEMSSRVGATGDYLVISIQKVESPLDDERLQGTVRTNEVEHWVFQIDASKKFIQRPFNAGASVQAFKAAAGVTPEVPYLDPDEGTTEVPLIDQNQNDILRNDDDDWFLYHGTVAPLQEKLRVYPQIPESQPDGVFRYLSSRRPASTEGDIVGYEDGNDVEDFYDPKTGISEFIAWNEGGNTSLSFGLYNSDQQRRITPKLSISGAGYSVSPVVGEDNIEAVIEAAIEDHPNVVHFQWGAIRDSFSFEVPDEWTDAENVITTQGALEATSVLTDNEDIGGNAFEDNSGGGL